MRRQREVGREEIERERERERGGEGGIVGWKEQAVKGQTFK